MTKILEEYIENKKVCSEYLFQDWREFLEVLYSQGGHIESILWFEHIKISEQKKSLGTGGYIDNFNQDYMYAETNFFEHGFDNKSLCEINDHIKLFIAKYKFLYSVD